MPVTLVGCSKNSVACIRSHEHEVWEVILINSGQGVYEIGGERFPCSAGTILCVPPRTPHCMCATDPCSESYILSSDFFVSERPEPLSLQDDEEGSFSLLMRAACRAFHERDDYSAGIMTALFDSMQFLMLRRLKAPRRNRYVEQLLRVITESYADPEFSLADAFSALPFSPDYLRRIFRRDVGATPVEYLTNLRMEHARRLLLQFGERCSVSEVALLCGFYDPRYFSRLFRRYTGGTPSQFIQRELRSATGGKPSTDSDASTGTAPGR